MIIKEHIRIDHKVLLCDLLSTWFKPSDRLRFSKECDWDELFKLANKTKTTGLIPKTLVSNKLHPPENLQNALNAHVNKIEAGNFQNLSYSIQILNTLTKAGVDYILFKGSLRSFDVYKSWRVRLSSDIDILVKKNDYGKSKIILRNNGYTDLLDPNSRWWNIHLGESPFSKVEGFGPTIDLHHELQQPGGPYPYDLDDFFANSIIRKFGKKTVKTLSDEDAMLISMISYGKAFRSGEPWLKYAHEIVLTYLGLTDEQKSSLLNSAKSQGLLRLHNEALKNSLIIFGEAQALSNSSHRKSDLIELAFGKKSHPPLFRTICLWKWLDGNFITRSKKFISGLYKVYRSEISRRSEE